MMTEYKNLAELKDAIAAERAEVLRSPNVRQYTTVQSRGLYVSWQESGCQNEWNGTLKDLNALIEYARTEHPEITEIFVSCGYDGADSPYDMNEGHYDPWIGEFDILVWKA